MLNLRDGDQCIISSKCFMNGPSCLCVAEGKHTLLKLGQDGVSLTGETSLVNIGSTNTAITAAAAISKARRYLSSQSAL